MIEALAIVLEVVGEFLVTLVIEVLGDVLFWLVPDNPGRRSIKLILGWLFALIGVGMGFVSTILLPNLLIQNEYLQVLNIVFTPVAVGLLLSHWGKARLRKGKRIGRVDRFFYGYVFALMVTLSRFVFTG